MAQEKYDTIYFITTGGTIDSRFEPTKDTVIPNEESTIKEYLDKLGLYNQYKFVEICTKDSRDITNEDRKKILKAVEESKHEKIIITHGTYTMAETALYLKDKLSNNKKIIIFIGSMIPLDGFYHSDAPFNLGYSISKIQILPAGIYVCMNGKVFEPEKVKKNVGEGRFEEV